MRRRRRRGPSGGEGVLGLPPTPGWSGTSPGRAAPRRRRSPSAASCCRQQSQQAKPLPRLPQARAPDMVGGASAAAGHPLLPELTGQTVAVAAGKAGVVQMEAASIAFVQVQGSAVGSAVCAY